MEAVGGKRFVVQKLGKVDSFKEIEYNIYNYIFNLILAVDNYSIDGGKRMQEKEQIKIEKEQIKTGAEILKDEEMEKVNGGVGISLPPLSRPQGWK